jgi:uncharacterized membrane protein
MRWSLFIGSCLMVGYVMLMMGAPLAAVIGGIGLAAAWNAWKKRGARAYEKN